MSDAIVPWEISSTGYLGAAGPARKYNKKQIRELERELGLRPPKRQRKQKTSKDKSEGDLSKQ